MSTCTIYNNISGALDQVITNLTMNALHHGFSENNGCTISIEVSEQADDSLRHKFSDNGCGIPIENRGKIFDPFSPRAEMKAAP